MPHRKKRGPYKRYLAKDSCLKMPRRTKNYINKKIKFDDSDSSSSGEGVEIQNNFSSSGSEASDDHVETLCDQHDCTLDKFIPETICSLVNIDHVAHNSDVELDDSDEDFQSPPSSPEPLEEFHCSDNDLSPSDNDDYLIMTAEPISIYSKEVLKKTLLMLAGKIRHSLTYAAAEDFSKLIDINAKNYIGHSSKFYSKKIVNHFAIPIQIHHFCPSCKLYAGAELNSKNGNGLKNFLKCIECDQLIDTSENRQLGNIFMHLPLADQLKHFYERNHTDILYSNSRQKQFPYNIESIFDSELYKKLIPDNKANDLISVNFSIDGTPLFKSSQSSITPILCSINELHPKQQRQHIMLVSVFFGSKKPIMNEYLKPFVAESISLATKGFDYVYDNIQYRKRCKILSGVTDSVERPELRCTTSFRGAYGCGFCLNEGCEIAKGRGSVRVYPLDKYNNAYGEGLRNHEDTILHSENRIKGVKCRAILCDVPGFDIIKGLCVDWMHCVALGVCRQFAKLWFDSANHHQKFYFHRFLNMIDEYLISIKPSSDASRTPRKMSDRIHWKAHEWVLWLLFYSLPIMKKLFPAEYVNHWSLLVDAISTLLQTSMTATDIYNAERKLIVFVKDVEKLYGKEHISFNIHLLTHLAQSCFDLGPLWTHSAFRYEDYHQILKKFVNSSNAANLQIIHSFQEKFVFEKLYDLYYNELTFSEQQWLDEILKKCKHPEASLVIGDIRLFGKEVAVEIMCNDDYLALQRLNLTPDPKSRHRYFKRIMINNEMIASKDYTRVKKRNSFTVLLTDNQVFEIRNFVVFEIQGVTRCYAFGIYYEKITNTAFPGRSLKHLTFTKKRSSLAVVDVKEIKHKVISVQMPSDEGIFVACSYPNRFEMIN